MPHTLSQASRRQFLAAGTSGLFITACQQRSQALPQGLLRVAIETEADSLDPLRGQFASAALLYKQLHAPLTEYAPSGGVAPGLAQSWRSDDGHVWRFTLRDELVWSDGMPLTSDDVVWTAQRAVDPRTGFADLGDFFAVIGAQEALTGERSPQDIGVYAPDSRTVIFELDRPVGNFPILMREFYPLPRHAVEQFGHDWIQPENWVSAGPYMLSRHAAMSYRLEKNPHFSAADSISISTIVVDVVDTPDARARRFRAGDYDLVERPATDQIGFLRERLGAQLRAYRAPILSYLKVNCAKPHLANPRIRQALSLAIDRIFLNTHFFNGEARPTAKIIPESDDTPLPEVQIEQARALLAEAGYTADNPLRLTLRATAGDRDRIAIAILDDLARIGVEGQLLASYPLDLYQAVDGGDYDLALARFDRGLKFDPDFMLQPFARHGFADNTNWTGALRDQFDTVIDQALAEIDTVRRGSLFARAEALCLEAMPNIPLIHENAYWLVSDRTQGPASIPPQLRRDLSLR